MFIHPVLLYYMQNEEIRGSFCEKIDENIYNYIYNSYMKMMLSYLTISFEG